MSAPVQSGAHSSAGVVERIASHILNGGEPFDAVTDALVAGTKAWKLNDETGIDEAIRACLSRIAASVEALAREQGK